MAVKKEMASAGGREFTGLIWLGIAVLLLLAVFSYDPGDVASLSNPPNHPSKNLIGPVGAWIGYQLFLGLGVGAFVLPVLLLCLSGLCMFSRFGRLWPKWVWALMQLLAVLVFLQLGGGFWKGMMESRNLPSPGGLMGVMFGDALMIRYLGSVGAGIAATIFFVTGFVMFFNVHLPTVGRAVAGTVAATWQHYTDWRVARMDQVKQLEYEQKKQQKERRRLEKALQNEAMSDEDEAELLESEPAPAKPSRKSAAPTPPEKLPEPVPAAVAAEAPSEEEEEQESPAAAPAPRPAKTKPEPKPEAKKETPPPAYAVNATTTPSGGFTLPPMALLSPLPPPDQRAIAPAHVDGAQILVDTLNEFGIEVKCTNVETGPVVTRYELLPAAGVRLERISGLASNIGLAMKAESVRVQAPIPGKGVVGVEVPNSKTNAVYLREVLESEPWRNSRAALPLAVGKDVGGRVIVADLADMPHMLIAGATGSGKTVCMNSLLAGMLMARTPAELRLILVDPKIVEFASYREIPHLVVPVITDAKKVSLGLRWCITEMENRYKILAKAGVRNIKSFNERKIVRQQELFPADAANGNAPPPEENLIPDRLPYIVVVIDELADLMLVAQAEIESHITRLAQLSRAVGIHMIIATQRPSVNVITGTIKANFPARIAFQVAQKVDSRTILDAPGADKLLGKGDLLFLPPGTGRLVRAQGCFTADPEVLAIAESWRTQGQPAYEVAIKEKLEKKTADLPEMDESDDMLEQAIEVIRQTKRASTSSLQRRLRIGYTRAARIIDLLEERGIVGPAQGSDPREILIDLDGDIPQNDDVPDETGGEKTDEA